MRSYCVLQLAITRRRGYFTAIALLISLSQGFGIANLCPAQQIEPDAEVYGAGSLPTYVPKAKPDTGFYSIAAIADEPYSADSKLTGDWFGLRTSLQEGGVTMNVSSTQFYQGVASGGLEQEFFYGGRNDYQVKLDGEKAGLWEGFSIRLHGETRYGESANFSTGALSPVNEFLLVPDDHGTASGLTGAKFTQYVTDSTLIYAGKINLLDEVRQPLTNAACLDGFMNLSLIFNPILARTLPYSAFGAGLVYLHESQPIFTLSVYDSRDASTTSVFDELFTNGAVVFGTAILPTHFFGRPGHHAVEAVYSTGHYTNISESPYLDPIGGLVFPGPPQAGTWALSYVVDQAVWVSPDDATRMWGVFGRLGLSDGNPNPLQWNFSTGVSGSSPLADRGHDQFGAAYFFLGVSETLKQAAQPLSPLRSEHGVELYYNARVKPWFQLTPNLQVVEPFEQQVDAALILGVRAKLDF